MALSVSASPTISTIPEGGREGGREGGGREGVREGRREGGREGREGEHHYECTTITDVLF